MPDWIIALLAAMPLCGVAAYSRNGSATGYFVLSFWLIGAFVLSVSDLAAFLEFSALAALIGATFRRRLLFGRWVRGQLSANDSVGDPTVSEGSQEHRTVAAKIDLATRQLADQDWQEAVQKYSALEPELLALFKAEADKQEVRRRICEAIVSNISVAEPAPDESSYELAWQRMLQAGFTNDERKMSMLFYRLTYLIGNSKNLERIESELSVFREGAEKLLRRPDPGVGEHFSGVYERLQKRLSQRRSPGY